ncbi:MAG: nucleotidyltransferase domain-containing protein [Nanoarchaeota archaeon]|nr:nucleotidyltransferase domain-containing protein [Nanoarchaeota archaeon]
MFSLIKSGGYKNFHRKFLVVCRSDVEQKMVKKNKKLSGKIPKKILEKVPSLKLSNESEIAMDFGVKAYKKFDKIIKSIILFGSTVKKTATPGSDIDIIIVIDDVSIEWNPELTVWYREELGRILKNNPYRKSLHINTIKLSTWWEDLIRGDPVLINILRCGESIIDFAGFFEPLKLLVINGKVRPSPEAIYSCLQRAPVHISRSKLSELNSVEGLYWAMVDSAHAALIAKGVMPPSPEHIPQELKQTFVDKGKLKKDYVEWYEEILDLHKDITHGKIHDLKGVEIDKHQERTEKFLETMIQLVKDIVGN